MNSYLCVTRYVSDNVFNGCVSLIYLSIFKIRDSDYAPGEVAGRRRTTLDILTK